jgi:hypothetical protein
MLWQLVMWWVMANNGYTLFQASNAMWMRTALFWVRIQEFLILEDGIYMLPRNVSKELSLLAL